MLHCHHQNDSSIKISSDESHFHGHCHCEGQSHKDSVHKPWFLKRGDPNPNWTEDLLLTTGPDQLSRLGFPIPSLTMHQHLSCSRDVACKFRAAVHYAFQRCQQWHPVIFVLYISYDALTWLFFFSSLLNDSDTTHTISKQEHTHTHTICKQVHAYTLRRIHIRSLQVNLCHCMFEQQRTWAGNDSADKWVVTWT